MSIQDFCQVNGIGQLKAINITAALEMAKDFARRMLQAKE
jgi:DNA repair protein RadC